MQEHQEPSHVQLAIMSRWYVVSRAIHTVAKLGLANHMSFNPMKVKDLAEASDTNPELLGRLLRFLSAYNIFKHEDDSYSLTELSLPLRDDAPNSIRDVLCMVDDCWWQAFSCLDLSLKTGISSFTLQHGDDFFSYLSKHPDKQTNFDKGMAKLSTFDDNAIAQSYHFSEFLDLIDLGGGRGGLIKALAENYPHIKLTLFDTPTVIEQLNPDEFPPQVQLVAGDFLAHVPKAEAYIFKGVLHDFNDQLMLQILNNCYKQIPKDSILFIAEQVLPDNDLPHPNKTMDIVMMALLGGRQRTIKEWQKSIEPAGFHYVDSYKTNTLFTLMAFKPEK